MKSRLLIIVLIGIITSSLAVLGISYIQFEAELEESIQNSSWVKDCIPAGPNDVVATIGIENKTHHFDLRNCVWLTNNDSTGSYKFDENLDADWITGEDYCGDWCDQNELYRLGCDQPIFAHLAKYSNLLDEEFNGKYAMEDIGLSDDASVEKFNECVDFIYEKRTSVELEESEIDRRRIGWTPAFEYHRVQINGTSASQVCSFLEISCPETPTFDAINRHDKNYTYFYYELLNTEYLVKIDDGQICYTTDDVLTERTELFERCIEIETED